MLFFNVMNGKWLSVVRRRLGRIAVYGWTGGAVALVVQAGGAARGLAPVATGPAPADSIAAAALPWPLAHPQRYLTSNFMEHRRGRFHAGLDLKTGGRTGYAVRAVEDGYVSRLRASPTGYGRAVYLHGRSGRTYVYAHLERFGDRIRPLVRAEQRRSERYRVDFYLAPQRLPVAAGEVLGLSGQSGTEGPHLHFEVRDAAQRPVNPLRYFSVPDTIGPVVEQLRAVPASATALIDGRPEAHLLSADRRGLRGTLPELTIRGPVAFAAQLVDRADGMGHRLEPYCVRLLLDDQEVFAAYNDRFEFGAQSQMCLEWLQADAATERWLHRRPANHLPGRKGQEWFRGRAGRGLPAGIYHLTLIATDYAGNHAECNWALRILPDSVVANAADGAGDGAAATGTGASMRWRPEPTGAVWPVAPGVAPLIRLTPLAGPRFYTTSGETLLAGGPPHQVIELSPAAGEPLYEPWQLYRLPGHADIAGAAGQGLSSDGSAMWYLAGDWPLRSPVAVPLPGTDLPWPTAAQAIRPPVSVGVYRFTEDGWAFEDRPLFTGDRSGWTFPLARGGLYAVMRDTLPPEIECWEQPQPVARNPRTARAGVGQPLWQQLAVGVHDTGAGIDTETVRVRLDDELLIVEPDPLRRRLLVELPDDLPAGEHILQLEVADRAGNTASSTLPLLCR